jgi:hypothetical protein
MSPRTGGASPDIVRQENEPFLLHLGAYTRGLHFSKLYGIQTEIDRYLQKKICNFLQMSENILFFKSKCIQSLQKVLI